MASTFHPGQPIAHRVLVIAHRGASALRPEHTLAAYSKAIADGADYIEPDLVSTRDGFLVARHENEIGGTTDIASHAEFASRKTTRVIDGVSETGWFTEDFTLAELKTLRARERLPDIRGTAYDGQFQLPTFDEIIDFVAAESATRGRLIGIIPEIKHSTYFAQLKLPMEDKVLAAIDAHAYTRKAPVEIQSFEVGNLRYLRSKLGQHHANVRLLQLMEAGDEKPSDQATRGSSLTYAQMMTPAGLATVRQYADAVGPSIRSLIPLDASGSLGRPTTLIDDAHRVGLEVHPYTFRPENHFLPKDLRGPGADAARHDEGSVAEMRRYLVAGIDAFFTDDPALGRKAVDGYTGR